MIRNNLLDLAEKRRQAKPHVIEDISYSKDFIVCRCGWRGTTEGYPEHRKDLGLARRR